MQNFEKILKDREREKKLRKIAQERGFSIEYPNRSEDEIRKDIEDNDLEYAAAKEKYEKILEKRRALEEKARKALDDYIEKNENGQTSETKRIEDFFTAEYNNLEGASDLAMETMLKLRESRIHLEKELEEGEKLHFRSDADRWQDFKKNSLKPFTVGILFSAAGLRILVLLIKYIRGVGLLSPERLMESLSWFILFTLLPVGAWIWSTCYKYWNIYNRKMRMVYLVTVNAFAGFVPVLAGMLLKLLLPYVLKIRPTTMITEEYIVVGTRIVVYILSLLPLCMVMYAVSRLYERPEVKEEILYYRFPRGKDLRKDKAYKYDLEILRNKATGKIYKIKQADLFIHMLIVGGTGTGKTSSVLLPAIQQIMDQMVHNMDFQVLEIEKMCSEGLLHIKHAFRYKRFDIGNFEPSENLPEEKKAETEKKLKWLNETSPVAGMIIACPDSGMADDAYRLAKGRNLNIYRVDPIRTAEGFAKEDRIGLNPLYISPLVTGMARYDAIVSNASIVMDLMSSMSEESGNVDAYFDSVNRIQTVVTCKLLLLTHESLYKVQPTMREVQQLLSDYDKMRPYVFELIRLYGNGGKPMQVPEALKSYSKGQLNRWFASQRIDCGLWQDVYTIITNELLDEKLGPIAKERANGLRNQLNIFLNTPRVNELICTNNTLDIDALLKNGGVVIFNYALELGESAYKALGQFFVMVYTQAILRRPLNEFRRPFFFFCDELPTLINKSMTPLWSLARKYGCSTICAMQSLSQFDQKRSIQFMKGTVLSSSGQKLYFGRLSPDEAEYVEKSSGTMTEYMAQDTVTQNSLTNDSPMLSYSTRLTPQKSPYVSADQAMYRDFQEITAHLVEDGSPVRMFISDTDFLQDAEWLGLPRPNISWERYYDAKTAGKDREGFSTITAGEPEPEAEVPSPHRSLLRVRSGKKKEDTAGRITISSSGKVCGMPEEKAEEERKEPEKEEKAGEEAEKNETAAASPSAAFSNMFGGKNEQFTGNV